MRPGQPRLPVIAAYAARDFLIGAVFLYGYVYAAYKFGNPLFGRNDFLHYKDMVAHPFDFSAAPAPFVLRQIPAIVAALFYKLGISYHTQAVADLIGFDDDTKRRFFAMILSNALAVCLSFTLLAGYLRDKLVRDSLLDLFALFGLFAAWFWFSVTVIAPVTVGWGFLASSLFIIAFLERNFALTCVGCALALFSRETTLIFAGALFGALLLFGPDRSRAVIKSVAVLAAACIAYLLIRKLFTSGYEHQISPQRILAALKAPHISRDFLFQSILSEALLLLLLIGIALRQPRHAIYLLLALGAVTLVAFATQISETAMLWGEALPFYAVMFFLAHARPAVSGPVPY